MLHPEPENSVNGGKPNAKCKMRAGAGEVGVASDPSVRATLRCTLPLPPPAPPVVSSSPSTRRSSCARAGAAPIDQTNGPVFLLADSRRVSVVARGMRTMFSEVGQRLQRRWPDVARRCHWEATCLVGSPPCSGPVPRLPPAALHHRRRITSFSRKEWPLAPHEVHYHKNAGRAGAPGGAAETSESGTNFAQVTPTAAARGRCSRSVLLSGQFSGQTFGRRSFA